jgi:hypothetical protein
MPLVGIDEFLKETRVIELPHQVNKPTDSYS